MKNKILTTIAIIGFSLFSWSSVQSCPGSRTCNCSGSYRSTSRVGGPTSKKPTTAPTNRAYKSGPQKTRNTGAPSTSKR